MTRPKRDTVWSLNQSITIDHRIDKKVKTIYFNSKIVGALHFVCDDSPLLFLNRIRLNDIKLQRFFCLIEILYFYMTGAERAALPVWEGKKLNPLAFWSFEDCFSYLRKHNVPYHPLHDVGFSSLGDMHSTKKVEDKVWFTYGGERSGRFQNLINKDGSAKTECGIHTEISTDLNLKK